MPERLARHMMVRTTEAAWAALMEMRPDMAGEPLVAGWAKAGYPLVVRRGGSEIDNHLIPLGLPLPPSHGKRRIAVALDREDIVSIELPPLLSEAATVAPVQWRGIVKRLVDLSPAVRTFGGLALQYQTGLGYLTAQSDLDLLWPLPLRSDVDGLLSAIATIAEAAPMRLDGELDGPAGAVNWRELLPGTDREILLKGTQDVRMVARSAFLAGKVT